MRSRAARVTLVLMFGPAAICAQLHLIAGTQTSNQSETSATTLFSVAADGTIGRVADLVPEKVGMEWIALSYDLRKAVILAKDGNPPLILDLDQAAVVKQCTDPPAEFNPLAGFYHWLSNVPGRGATFEWYAPGKRLGRVDVNVVGTVRGMIVDPGVPCERSFLTVLPNEMQYRVAHGTAGVGDHISPETPGIVMDENGNLDGGRQVFLGYQIPAGLRTGLDTAFAGMEVNNSQVMVVGLVKDAESTPRTLAFRKRDKTWHVIPNHSWSAWCIRGFGKFVSIVETAPRRRTPAASGTAQMAAQAATTPAESPGRSEWRAKPNRLGPSMVESFEETNVVFPGKLHLYDIESEKLFTIDTKQGDSEILLVEDGTVYYRISDRLYSAPVTDAGIGKARLVATDEVIRDAHWAFIKR